MLINKKINILADTILDEKKIATHGAVLDTDKLTVAMSSRNIDNDACKVYRDIVRADRAEFEDFVYDLQDMLKTKMEQAEAYEQTSFDEYPDTEPEE